MGYEGEKEQKTKTEINYYIIAAIFISVLLFTFANSIEPQIDYQMDIFELIFSMAYAAPAIFSFFVAKKMRGGMFGKAYLALTIAYGLGAIGSVLFTVFQMFYGIDNPYPNWPDAFFICFYLFALYHLTITTRLDGKKKLNKGQKTLVIIIPLAITSIYVFSLLAGPSLSVSNSVPDLLSHEITIGDTTFQLIPSTSQSQSQHLIVDNVTYDLIPLNLTDTKYPQIYDSSVRLNLSPIFFKNTSFGPQQSHDMTFWPGFFAGTYYVAATTAVFAWALVGAQVFRKSSMLGTPWALLVVGLGLNSVGDVTYYFTSIYSYDRTTPILGIWVLGFMIASYALYLHRKRIAA